MSLIKFTGKSGIFVWFVCVILGILLLGDLFGRLTLKS